jgi:L-fuculose-phosphate aldolase
MVIWPNEYNSRRAGSGIPYSHPDADEIKQKRETIYPPRAVENLWQYYNRKLDRLEGM